MFDIVFLFYLALLFYFAGIIDYLMIKSEHVRTQRDEKSSRAARVAGLDRFSRVV